MSTSSDEIVQSITFTQSNQENDRKQIHIPTKISESEESQQCLPRIERLIEFLKKKASTNFSSRRHITQLSQNLIKLANIYLKKIMENIIKNALVANREMQNEQRFPMSQTTYFNLEDQQELEERKYKIYALGLPSKMNIYKNFRYQEFNQEYNYEYYFRINNKINNRYWREDLTKNHPQKVVQAYMGKPMPSQIFLEVNWEENPLKNKKKTIVIQMKHIIRFIEHHPFYQHHLIYQKGMFK